MTVRDTLNARTETCPTCGSRRNGSWSFGPAGRVDRYNSNGRVRTRRGRFWERRAKRTVPDVKPIRVNKMRVKPSKGNEGGWISRSTIQCVDKWHDVERPEPVCHLDCRKHPGVRHWHAPRHPSQPPCEGECYNHKHDPENRYSTPDGFEEPHWHEHTELPRIHKTEEERKAKRLAKRRRSDKRKR